MELNKYLDLSPEVAEALQNGRPVVALESTIISHGMPYPQNVETALNVEQIIRKNGRGTGYLLCHRRAAEGRAHCRADRVSGQNGCGRGQGQPPRSGGTGSGERMAPPP